MPLVRVKQNYQVTIPLEVRERLCVEEGDLLEATVQDDAIVLRPKVLVDRNTQGALTEGMKDYKEAIGPKDSRKVIKKPK